MSIHNDVTLKNMTYNGQEVKRWIHNGVQVFLSVEPFYIIKNSAWVDSSYGWTCTSGEGANWGVNGGNLINNSDDYSMFKSTSWNTKGLTNVRVKISQNGGTGSVTINGTNLGNLLEKAWGEYTGTVSGTTCSIDMGLDGGAWCYIEELYFY